MTPPDLDVDIVHARLRMMRELLDDLAGAGDLTANRLEADRMTRHAVERILTQLVELAVAVNGHVAAALLGRGPSDYRESFQLVAEAGVLPHELAARLAPSAGLRNLLVHEYAKIDLARIAESAAEAIEGYREYIRVIAEALSEQAGGPRAVPPG